MTSLGRCVAIDENGSPIKVSDTTWYREGLTVEACGLATAGGEGLYGYSFENGTLYVEKYLPETGKWEEGSPVSPPEEESVSGQGAWCGVYSGGDGLLLSTEQGLWNLNPASGELTACFSFQDTYVNLQGGEVQFAAQLPEGGYLLMLYGQEQQSFVAVEPQEASVSALTEPEDQYKELPESDLSPAAALREGEYLVYFTVIARMNGYLDLLEAFGDYADIVSYPTRTGEARYTMVNNDALGINSASANQEGAWDFIEYVLLRAVEGPSFSVLQETFEDQLFPDFSSDKTHYNQYLGETLPVGRDAVTEEQAEEMRSIIAHSVWNNPIDCREIRSIIQEETAYFFEGDKTAEDVADIIQRRVTLLLNE